MQNSNPKVAYFSMEFGLDPSFKIYAGGLGILAGDYLKAAKENNLPVVGVGIKWKQGYVEQHIDKDGRIVDSFYNNEYDFLQDTGVKIKVNIRGRDVCCKVWKVDCYGNSELYLLDTDLPENADRWITGQLYGWFEEERIAQEMILGIGGIRALRALNKNVDIFHFNEGHAIFAGFELIREKRERGYNPYDAWNESRKEIVFTTHTPVWEGNEFHSLNILEYMGAFNGLDKYLVKEIGGEPFNMTAAGLRLSKKSNAVSMLHGRTANEMWKSIDRRSEIISITNGVHLGTWGDKVLIDACRRGENLWNYHMDNKEKLIDFIEEEKGIKLDKNKLLIGFARRAAPYKRGDLIFTDEEKIAPLLSTGDVQIIISTKAHPLDFSGKEIIKHILSIEKKYPNSVVFLDNYNMNKALLLTRGVDVWLNNPRVTKEACGTSGMKAAINGVLNLSTLDGWWPEACWDEVTGWQIGGGFVSDDIKLQDKHDAESLYDVLFNKVLKTYYNDRKRWTDMMAAAINGMVDRYSADRMIKEYYEKLYK
ncbi:alpha-glucan family phosphorylase [Clostridium sp. A1-XYC3]|uniref:Alpha-glucan family phosphorylase n=1 Tax=Clostridium tanneri TaxID=3037988 RepID=A0ABU4JV43_9CLOT|nr:alpha-glucan family phosphorylase [Clostridium sp. A1-XYC3]MDW8802024.1 alpha-glucan family phosphorylase [Clostridium sp. A1-XYC3]